MLDHWREPESYDDSPVREVDDPTARTLDAAVRELPSASPVERGAGRGGALR